MEKADLLKLLFEKKIISTTEGFDNVTKEQLEDILDNGMKLIAESVSKEEINRLAIEAAKEQLLEDKDTFVKNLAIENKRLKQSTATLEEACKSKLKEFAKLFDKSAK